MLDDVTVGNLVRPGQRPAVSTGLLTRPAPATARLALLRLLTAGEIVSRGWHPRVPAVARNQPLQLDHPLTQRGVLGPKFSYLRPQIRARVRAISS